MSVTLAAWEEVPACVAEGPPSGAVGLRADGLVGEDADSVEVACEARGPQESAYGEESGSSGQGNLILIFASSSLCSFCGGGKRLHVRTAPFRLVPDTSNEGSEKFASERQRGSLGELPVVLSEPMSTGLLGQCGRGVSQALVAGGHFDTFAAIVHILRRAQLPPPALDRLQIVCRCGNPAPQSVVAKAKQAAGLAGKGGGE